MKCGKKSPGATYYMKRMGKKNTICPESRVM